MGGFGARFEVNAHKAVKGIGEDVIRVGSKTALVRMEGASVRLEVGKKGGFGPWRGVFWRLPRGQMKSPTTT